MSYYKGAANPDTGYKVFIGSSFPLFSPESGKIFPQTTEVRNLQTLCSNIVALWNLRKSQRLKVAVTAAAHQDLLSQRPVSPVSRALLCFIESFCPMHVLEIDLGSY